MMCCYKLCIFELIFKQFFQWLNNNILGFEMSAVKKRYAVVFGVQKMMMLDIGCNKGIKIGFYFFATVNIFNIAAKS